MKTAPKTKEEVLRFAADIFSGKEKLVEVMREIQSAMDIIDIYPYGSLKIEIRNPVSVPTEIFIRWYSLRKQKLAQWNCCGHLNHSWPIDDVTVETSFNKRWIWAQMYPDRCLEYLDLKVTRPYIKKGYIFPLDAQEIHVLGELCGMLLIACDLKGGVQGWATYICTPVGYIWAPVNEEKETYEDVMAHVVEWLASLVSEPSVPDLKTCQWQDIVPIWTMAALAGLLEPDGCL